jgi:hypothetical protein
MVNQFGKFNSNQKEPNSTSFGSNQIIPSYNPRIIDSLSEKRPRNPRKIDSVSEKPLYNPNNIDRLSKPRYNNRFNPFVDTRYNPNLDPESVSYDDGINILPQEKEDVPKGLIPQTPEQRKMFGWTPYDMRRS